MPLNIKSETTDRLARDLAAVTGESITRAITIAIRERLQRVRRGARPGRAADLQSIWEASAQIPLIDQRTVDEILGYGDHGTFD